MMVLASHYLLITGYWVQNNLSRKYLVGALDQNVLGQGGVVLFFTISGYLVGGPYVRALSEGRAFPRVGPYALRRAARLLPAYWVALIGAFVLYAPSGLIRPSLGRLLIHGLLLQSYVTNQNRDFPLLGVAWTLVIELTFYAALPLAAVILRRAVGKRIGPRGLIIIVGTAGIVSLAYALWSCSVHTFGTPESTLYLDNLLGYGFLFCPGLLLAIAEQAGLLGRLRRGAMVGAAVVALLATLACCYATNAAVYELRYLCLAVAAGAAFSLALTMTRPAGRLGRGWAALGIVSYGIYLWHLTLDLLWVHQLPVAHIHRLLADIGIDLQISSGLGHVLIWIAGPALGLVVTLPLAIVSWKLIEKPAIALAAARTTNGRSSRGLVQRA